MLYEGNEVQGKYGKQGCSITRRCIAVATHQGGSTNLGSQIFPEFVQVQTGPDGLFIHYNLSSKIFKKLDSVYRLRAICELYHLRFVA